MEFPRRKPSYELRNLRTRKNCEFPEPRTYVFQSSKHEKVTHYWVRLGVSNGTKYMSNSPSLQCPSSVSSVTAFCGM